MKTGSNRPYQHLGLSDLHKTIIAAQKALMLVEDFTEDEKEIFEKVIEEGMKEVEIRRKEK